MSTSSSSECSCLYCHYNAQQCYNYGAFRTPFYPTMGEPLVYYAQVSKGTENNRESRKGNPNCFVKAFRWYTQERCGSQKMGSPNSRMDPDVANFAAWLDSRYKEFVREGRLGQDYQFNTRTIIPVDDVTNNDAYCEPCEPLCVKKRFARLRSPWKKRSSANKNESGDLYDREPTNKSLEYIMVPKNLLCPASECRHQPCCSESQVSKIITVRSQSMTSICQNNEMCTVNALTSPDGDKIRDNSSIRTPMKKMPDAKTEQVPKRAPPKKQNREVSCQCINISAANSQSQYERLNAISNVELVCPTCQRVKESQCPDFQPVSRKQSETNQVAQSVATTVSTKIFKSNIPYRSCEKKFSEYRTDLCMNCKCPTYYENDIQCCDNRISSTRDLARRQNIPLSRPVEEEGPSTSVTCKQRPRDDETVETPHRCPQAISINNTVQTSDHSIILGEGTHNCYPLFMKIMCADKLHE